MSTATPFEAMDTAGETADARTAGAVRTQLLDRAEILALPQAQWDRLAREALVENPFYDRRQVVAALETVDRGKAARAVAFHVGDVLAGLFLYQPRSKVPAPLPAANSFINDYLVHGLPLVHRRHADAVAAAWLDMVHTGRGPALWAFDDVDTSSPLMRMLTDGAAARGMRVKAVLPYERAYLTRLDGGFEAHLNEVLSKNRLKDVRRTMRRLSEVGTIELEHVEGGEKLTQRVEDFLALEHAGWKGTMGTSFLSHEADAAFARAGYVEGLAWMDSLLLDGKPIAMKLYIRTGEIGFTPKIAYDEAHKKLGPGMALEYMLIEDFYASKRMTAVDAAATAEGHSALNFFNNHKPMATVIIGRHGWQVRLLARLHEGREEIKLGVKALKARIAALRERKAAPVEKAEG